MPTRPILDENTADDPPEPPSHDSGAPASQPNRFDSPLASQLPAWDLLPAHTMLVRRRSTKSPAKT